MREGDDWNAGGAGSAGSAGGADGAGGAEPPPRVARLERALQRGPALWLPEPLESGFREWLNQAYRMQRRAGGAILLVTLASLIGFDALLYQRMDATVWFVFGAGIFIPIAVAIALEVSGRVPVTSAAMIGLHAWLGAAYLAILALLAAVPSTKPYTWEAYLILSIATYFFSGLRLVESCGVGFGMLAGYAAVEFALGLAPATLMETSLFLLGANVVGAAARYQSERVERRQYLSAELLRELAEHDALTGVRNRRALEAALAGLLQQAQRGGAAVTLALVDLDHFKQWNDTLGHAAGDALLRRTAAALQRQAVGPLDVVARVGGDEFACAWHALSDAEVATRVARAHALVQAELQGHGLAGAPPASLSLGAVHVPAQGTATPQAAPPQRIATLLAQADDALYFAKRSGRACAALSRGDGMPQRLDAPLAT